MRFLVRENSTRIAVQTRNHNAGIASPSSENTPLDRAVGLFSGFQKPTNRRTKFSYHKSNKGNLVFGQFHTRNCCQARIIYTTNVNNGFVQGSVHSGAVPPVRVCVCVRASVCVCVCVLAVL